jgi:hypothetical protein
VNLYKIDTLPETLGELETSRDFSLSNIVPAKSLKPVLKRNYTPRAGTEKNVLSIHLDHKNRNKRL